MGVAKDQMTAKTSEGKGLFNKLGIKKKAKETVEQKAETIPDMLAKVDRALTDIILVKENDVKNEKGQEVANQKKVAILRTMLFHIEQAVEVGSEYDEVK